MEKDTPMKFLDWFRRFTDHTQAAAVANADTWDAERAAPTADYAYEWPHITGDDSAFWEQMERGL